MDNKSNHNFITHFLTIGAGTLISMAISLVSTPIITRIVDPNEYGQFSIFTMYTNIAVMVLCMGLDQSLVRYYYDNDDMAYKQSLVKACFVRPIFVSALCALLVSILAYSGLVTFEFAPLIMLLLGVNVIVTIWSRLSAILLRVTYQSKKYAASNIVLKAVYICAAIALIMIFKRDYLLMLCIATCLSVISQALFATVSTRKYWNFKKTYALENKSTILKYGYPFILSMGLTTIFQALDKMSLNHYCTYSEVGIYSSAMTMVNIFAVIQTTFNTLWAPLQVEHYVKNPEDTSFIRRGNAYITVIMFFIGMSLILCKDLFALLLGAKYRSAATILPFLIFNPIMYTISETTCSGIGISQKSHLNIWVSLGACITNLIGNIMLVPRLGSQGAAISTGISYIVFWALRTYFSNKYYYINYRLWKFYILIAFTIGYAWYNTFYDFSSVAVVGYVVGVVLLLVLYRNDVIELFAFGRKQIAQIIPAKKK